MKVRIAGLRLAALLAFACVVSPAPAQSQLLSWEGVTQNEDGSPLTDLGGYIIYWGSAPDALVPIAFTPPGATTYWLPDNGGVLQFVAITSYNLEGLGSGLSPVVAVPVYPTP
jgi:hypothetical protein